MTAIRVFREPFEGGGGGGGEAIVVIVLFFIFIPVFISIDLWIKLSANLTDEVIALACKHCHVTSLVIQLCE
jgi:hypothetical protein